MRWLSQGIEALVGAATQGEVRPAGAEKFDVIVVGSGYGGAVAACRFAEAGYAVCVLERGREYLAGEFPNDIANLPGQVRAQRDGVRGVMGNRDGLFDLRLHNGVGVLVGNALGGGSQINANVALRADPALFRQAQWPKALRETNDPLDQYYTRVEDMLDVAPYPHRCQKEARLAQLAEPISRHLRKQSWTAGDRAPQARAYRPPLAVNHSDGPNRFGVAQRACVGCGDCVTGCNYGAKNTLTMNYLPQAVRYGARLYTGSTVLAVRPNGTAGNATRATTVYFCASTADWASALARDGAERASALDQPGIYTLSAEIVVLAAGSLGSTEILLRSSRHGFLHKHSPRLGKGFSGNGDWLGFGFDLDDRVNAVGLGATEPEARSAPGPTIAGVLDMREGLPVADGALLEDGIVPGPLAHLVHELLSTASTLEQLDSCTMKREGRGEDPLALSDDALQRTQVYLGMGHDDAAGEMFLEDGTLQLRWSTALGQRQEARMESCLQVARRALGGIALRNPLAHPLPASTSKLLSGPKVEGSTLVVHPLGGCPMGDSILSGVVDDWGAVYSGDTPDAKYGSLYVWDGSILPGSLGVNPFLTIAALAERAAEFVIARRAPRARPDALQTLPEHRIPAIDLYRSPAAQKVAVLFRETLRSKKNAGFPDAALHLEFRSPDLLATLKKPSHLIDDVRGTLTVPSIEREPLTVIGGTITTLERVPDSGRLRTLRGLWVWFRKRGANEIVRYWKERRAGRRAPYDLSELAVQTLRMAYHSAERRAFRYDLRLQGAQGHYRLRGEKPIEFGVNSNVWESLVELQATLSREDSGEALARGVLRMDIVALADADVPQIEAASDTPNALAALVSYGTLFLRVILKLHLWDFRAPDYRPRTLRAPLRAQRPLFVERTVLAGQPIAARRHWLKVPLREESDAGIDIALTRLRAPSPSGPARGTPVILIPGFAQSTRAFVAEPQPEDIVRAKAAWPGRKDAPLREDLVRHLLAKGFDVWLLDYRSSTALASCRLQCDLDAVARFDIPRAVAHVRETLEHEGWRPVHPAPEGRGDITVIAHCMGSASLGMSLLSGRLEGQLRAAVLSQVPPKIIGGTYSQFHRHLAALFRDVLRIDVLNVVADDNQSALDSVLDRIFATLPVPDEERCPGEDHRTVPVTGVATCKRISGIIGPLYLHRNLVALHPYLDQYFGVGNIAAFNHVAKFFEYERVVSADGANIYLNNDNIQAHMDLPIALLHGTENKMFLPESSQKMFDLLHAATGREHHELVQAEGYAHFDCLAGDYAYQDVYPKLSEFLLRHV